MDNKYTLDEFRDYLRKEIETLENKKTDAIKKIEKELVKMPNVDSTKLNKLFRDKESIDFAIFNLYSIIGGIKL